MDEQAGDQYSLADKLKEVELLLDEYENKIHISQVKIIETDLMISRQVLMSMHYEDLQGLVWEYAQYTLALQKEINKHTSRHNWAETNLKRILEREAGEYPGWKWEERMSNVLTDNSYAQKLHHLKMQSKLVIDRLAFLPAKIQCMTDIAKDIIKTKRYKNVEHSD